MWWPNDTPSTQQWLVRTSAGESSFASFPELLALKREGKIPKGFFYHPVEKAWCKNDEIEYLYVCNKCGYIGYPIEHSHLNGCVAILLLLLFILPGHLYWNGWQDTEKANLQKMQWHRHHGCSNISKCI